MPRQLLQVFSYFFYKYSLFIIPHKKLLYAGIADAVICRSVYAVQDIKKQPAYDRLFILVKCLFKRLLRERILLVGFFHNVDLTAHLFEFDLGFFAFGYYFV